MLWTLERGRLAAMLRQTPLEVRTMARPISTRFVDQVNVAVAGGQAQLNTQGMIDDTFIVRSLLVKMTYVFGAGGGATGEVDHGNTTFNARWRKTGNSMLTNTTARALDLWSKAIKRPRNVAVDVLQDQIIGAGGGTATFAYEIPFFRGAQPAGLGDYEQPLSEIGDFQIQIPAAFTPANFAGCLVSLIAVGYRDRSGPYRAGTQFRIQDLVNDGSLNPQIPIGGGLLRELDSYVVDVGVGTQNDEVRPSLYFDGDMVLDGNTLTQGELSRLTVINDVGGVDDYAAFYPTGVQGAPKFARLYAGGSEDCLSDLPSVRTAQLQLQARGANPNVNCRYIVETVYPNGGASLAARIPGAGSMEGGDVANAVRREDANGSAVPGSSIRPAVAQYTPALVSL
jgi:hypothetical protein